MVELVEVEDESFETKNAAGLEDDEDYYTDTGMSQVWLPPQKRSFTKTALTRD